MRSVAHQYHIPRTMFSRLMIGFMVCCLLVIGCTQQPETEEPEHLVFEDRMLKTDETFVLNNSKSCIGRVRLELLEINDSRIKLQRIGDEKLDGHIHEQREKRNITLTNRSCIPAPALCMDVSYEYCLALKAKRLTFNISTESTMPGPE